VAIDCAVAALRAAVGLPRDRLSRSIKSDFMLDQ
jgi:hypothetical protein